MKISIVFLVTIFSCANIVTAQTADLPELRNAEAKVALATFENAVQEHSKVHDAELADRKKKLADEIAKIKDDLVSKLEASLAEDLKEQKLDSAVAIRNAVKFYGDFVPTDEAVKELAAKIELPEHTVEQKGHHYLFVKKTLTRNMARKHAERLGGHLLRIDDEAELQFALQLIKDKSNDKEIGPCPLDGNDELTETNWLWSNGEKVNFLRWESSEPNNGKDGLAENALFLNVNSGRMTDLSFDLRTYSIVEWDQ